VAACRGRDGDTGVAVALPSVVVHYGTVAEGERGRSMIAAAVSGRVRVVTWKFGVVEPVHRPCLCSAIYGFVSRGLEYNFLLPFQR
jgi:hypothetical protein